MTKTSLFKSLNSFRKALGGKAVKPFGIEIRKKNKTTFHAEVQGSPIKSGGNVIGILAVVRDLTKRKIATDTMKKSEEKYRSIFDCANDAIFVNDMKTGRIIDANKSASEMFGYTKEEVLKLNINDLSSGKPPYTQKEAMQLMKKAVWESHNWLNGLQRTRLGGCSGLISV